MDINDKSHKITGHFDIRSLRKIKSQTRRFIIECDEELTNDEIKEFRKLIEVIVYPNLNNLIKAIKCETLFIPSHITEIVGADKFGPKTLHLQSQNIKISGVGSLEQIYIGEIDTLEIQNCAKLSEICVKSANVVTIIGKDTGRSIKIRSSGIKTLIAPKTVEVITYGGNILLPNMATSKYYNLSIVVCHQETLDRLPSDAMNVNVLKIATNLEVLDLTRFDLTKVTTFMLETETCLVVRPDSLPSVISWSSPPIINYHIPEMPRLMFLFIIGGYPREDTKKIIYEHADNYKGALNRANLKMDIRSKHEDNSDSLDIDIMDLADSLARVAIKPASNV